MSRNSLFAVVALTAVGLTVLVGCGPEKVQEYEISGAITLDGDPIQDGSIKFVSVDGEARTGGGVIKEGTYTAMAPPGKKKVLVLAHKVVGQEPEYEGVPDSPMRDVLERLTPEAYNAKELTPLEADITGPTEGLDFQLQSKLK